MKDPLPLHLEGYMDPASTDLIYKGPPSPTGGGLDGLSSTVLIHEGSPPPTGEGLDGPHLHCVDS